MVTKSMVMSYHPSHFAEAAEHYSATANTWLDSSGLQYTEVAGLTWQGLAGAAYRAVSAADHATVTAAAEQAHAAAAMATADGAQVWAALSAAQHAISAAESAGFTVSEDLGQVSDSTPAVTAAQRQARQAQAGVHAQHIAVAVRALVSADTQAAGRARAATDFSLYHRDVNDHIMTVDDKKDLGTDPHTGQPIPPPPPGPVPEGKQWWYHAGTGWKLDDHLKPCDGVGIFGDALSIGGAALLPQSAASILTDLNALRAIIHIDQCEGP
jgi:hypothetical protein